LAEDIEDAAAMHWWTSMVKETGIANNPAALEHFWLDRCPRM